MIWNNPVIFTDGDTGKKWELQVETVHNVKRSRSANIPSYNINVLNILPPTPAMHPFTILVTPSDNTSEQPDDLQAPPIQLMIAQMEKMVKDGLEMW